MENPDETRRWLVVKLTNPMSYSASWTMLRNGHCVSKDAAIALANAYHDRYPKATIQMVETVGKPIMLFP